MLSFSDGLSGVYLEGLAGQAMHVREASVRSGVV